MSARVISTKKFLCAALLCFLLLCACSSALGVSAASEALPPESGEKVVVTFLGDCTLGSEEHERAKETSFDSYVLKYGWDYPFSGVQTVIGQDDLTVANLEGVFYNYEANKAHKTYNFRAPTSFAQILPVSSIEAVSLSNNHTEDYGQPGMRDTLASLQENGIPWFATAPYANGTYIYEKGNVRIGFVSVYLSQWQSQLQQLKNNLTALKDARCSLIVAVMHGGVEYAGFHEDSQERLASFFIRYGAKVVVGHHPHVLQGVQVKDDATIVYSLGNFVFGGNKKMRAYQTALAQFTFYFDEDGVYQGQQLNLIPAHYSGSRDYNDYRPVLVSGQEAQDVIATIQRDTGFRLAPYQEGTGAVQAYLPAAAED
ncbi:MAG: CapA family protein [Clostridiales bacterium]|nr:CapA family protein [Clostridiales bacterium]